MATTDAEDDSPKRDVIAERIIRIGSPSENATEEPQPDPGK